jgi:hypothetical protein
MFRVPTPQPGETVLILAADYNPAHPVAPIPATVLSVESPSRLLVEAQHRDARVTTYVDHLSVTDLSKACWTWGSRPHR